MFRRLAAGTPLTLGGWANLLIHKAAPVPGPFQLLSRGIHNPLRFRKPVLSRAEKKRVRSRAKLLTKTQPFEAPTPLALPVAHAPKPILETWLTNFQREPLGILPLNYDVFGQEMRMDLIHRVVEWQRAKRRAGTKKVKTRGEVSGTGRKPHPQKGTGRARAGSLRSPIHRKGGHALAILPRNFEYGMMLKVRRRALKVALSAKFQEGNLFILEDAKLEVHKTANLVKLLANNWTGRHILFVHSEDELDANLVLAGRLLRELDFIPQNGLNVFDIIRHNTLFVTRKALDELELRLTKPYKQDPKFAVPERAPLPSSPEMQAFYNAIPKQIGSRLKHA